MKNKSNKKCTYCNSIYITEKAKYCKRCYKIVLKIKDMYKMRMDGKTLREIGDVYNISRERVNQLLQTRAPKLGCDAKFVYSYNIMEKLKMEHGTFLKWVKRAGLKSKSVWTQQEASDMILLINKAINKRKCRICGESIPRQRTKFCSEECYLEFMNNQYKYSGAEQRKKHHACVKKWMLNNPERTREIQLRATRRYQNKKRVAVGVK